MAQEEQARTATAGTQTTRVLAALIIVPLMLVAALVTLNRYTVGPHSGEARVLTEKLDRTLGRAAAPRNIGVAVLPLRNRSNLPELEFLTSGVAEEIRSRLASVPGLQVIGSESSANVAGENLPMTDAARLLGAAYVLVGRFAGVQRDLTIELELYSAEDEKGPVWGEAWQGSVDMLPVTTQAIAARVLETVLPGSPTTTAQRAPSSAALGDYLLGKYLIDRYNRPEVAEGLSYLESAIRIDPGFERAYAAKIAGHQRMTWIDAQNTELHEDLIDQTIQGYLALAVETPLTYRLRALHASITQRPFQAFEDFSRAAELAPQEYAYDRGYMMDLCKAGYLQNCLEQAKGLARADPVSAAAHSGLATVYLLLGQYELMMEHAEMSGRFGGDLAGFYRAEALLRAGDLDMAESVLEKAMEAVGVSIDWIAPYIEALRNPAAAPAAVAAMQATDEGSSAWTDLFYIQYFQIGEMDLAYKAAFELVERQFETWHLWLWEPTMAEFRNDPRFIEIMTAIGMLEVWRSLGDPDLCTGPSPEPFCAAIGPPG